MTAGAELEDLLRRLIREELAKVLDGAGNAADPDDDVRQLAIERAARMKAARKVGAR